MSDSQLGILKPPKYDSFKGHANATVLYHEYRDQKKTEPMRFADFQ